MADADPFVKRMLARSEARRAMMARLGDGGAATDGKENKPQHTSQQPAHCKHKGAPQMDGSNNTEVSSRPTSILQAVNLEPVPPQAPPLPSSKTLSHEYSPTKQHSPSKAYSATKTYSPSKTSPTKTYSPSKKYSPTKSSIPPTSHVGAQASSRPMGGGRLTALARRQQQMQEWEDDYNYHSSNGGAKEAQGFTPTTSQSRLIYDFKKEQEEHKSKQEQQCIAPEEPLQRPCVVQTPEPPAVEQTDGGEVVAPKILSCVMKDSPSPDRCVQPSERGRTNSTSGVQQLRSRWEQQIRDHSPEKGAGRERSCSPVKPHSVRRSVSPVKKVVQHPSSSTCIASPSKSCSSLAGVQLRHVSQSTELPHRSTDARATCVAEAAARGHARGRSPTKAVTSNSRSHAHEVVKGVCPMPLSRPVMEEPHQSSVLARAAAFTAAMDQVHEVPQKDPAELSLQGRRQLFERRGEEALLPKAPFATSVPAKVLSNGGSVPPVARPQQNRMAPRSVAPTPGVSRCHEALAAAASASSTDSAWQQQKQRELQALHDRFPRAAASQPNDSHYSDDSDCYPESESSYPDSSSTVPIASPGPPKPPRVQIEDEYAHEDMAPPAPPLPVHMHSRSPYKDSLQPAPTKYFEPRVKDGCLYPGLSDVESQSEAEPDDRPNDSAMTCASEESLGARIQRVARSDRQQYKPLHSLLEEDADDTMEKGDLSAALDEAFSDEEATTPPKRLRDQEQLHGSPYSRGQHKTPRLDGTPARPSAGDTPLTHTISMYRKQRPTEVQVTPVRQLIQRPSAEQMHSPAPAVESPSVTATVRIKHLADMESSELRIISQASVAVNVAEQRPEQRGAAHHIEAEKLLLLATHRRQAVLAEIQRVKTEASMGGASWSQQPDTSRGSLTLSDLSLPLSQDFLGKGINECPQHVVVLVKHRELVVSSVVQSTPACVVNGALSFPTNVTLDDLTPDFVVTLEVYALKMAPAPQTNLKKDPSRMKLTPLKRLQQQHSRSSPACTVSSPGGPGAVRTSAFTLIGFTHLTIATLNRSAWTLDKVPLSSPLSGHLLLRVQCQLQGGVSGRGFLTAFQDVSGLGAWTRRWAVLDGPTVRFWSYPDQENKKECINHVPLKLVSTRRVELVSRDVCARPNTFLLTTVRPTQAGDTNSLVTDLAGNSTVTKHLLSADSAEERIEWCRKLNIALANIRAWDPDAVRPNHYNV